MSVESQVNVQAGLVPRHYTLVMQAALAPPAMLELVLALDECEFDDDSCGGFFGKLRAAVVEAYGGDVPQKVDHEVELPDDEDSGSAVTA